MAIQRAFIRLTGQVPELATAPWSTGFHIAAEWLTALGLVVAGAGLLGRRTWARPLLLAAGGIVLYSAINSPGYFAQQSVWAPVAMFAAVCAGTVFALVRVARASPTGPSGREPRPQAPEPRGRGGEAQGV